MAKVNAVNVSRSFDHKAHGRIGIVELVAEVGEVLLNGSVLPATSVEYLLTFALQNLQDAYAGAESADDAVGRFNKKYDRLVQGTIGVREAGGASVSAEQKMIRTVIADMLRKAGKAEVLKEHEDDRAEFLDGIFAKQSEDKQKAIMATVAQRIAEAAERAKQAKALASGLDL